MNFREDFQNIFNGFQSLQNHLEIELNSINQRLEVLEYKQTNDDVFFQQLEMLIKQRNETT